MSSGQAAERVGGTTRSHVGAGIGVRLVRALAWALVGAGVLVALYLVYSLFFTNLQTGAAQEALRAEWDTRVAGGAPDPDPAAVPDPAPDPDPAQDPAPAPAASATAPGAAAPTPAASATSAPEVPTLGAPAPEAPGGGAVALLWFERPDGPDPVTDEPYVVVAGTTLADLTKGPGHYLDTADPGGDGNFAVAGHRTTHGAPFFHLDELQEGDLIHVVDGEGDEYVYAYERQQIVAPTRLDVLGSRPLGVEGPTITLTTCHPRFSNRQRLVVVGTLVGEPAP